MTFWEIIISIATGKINKDTRERILKDLKDEIQQAWDENERKPQSEKDASLITVAGRMGCQSRDIIIAKKFLNDYFAKARTAYYN